MCFLLLLLITRCQLGVVELELFLAFFKAVFALSLLCARRSLLCYSCGPAGAPEWTKACPIERRGTGAYAAYAAQ